MADEVKIPINLPGAAQAAADAGKVAAGLQGIGKASAEAGKSLDEGKKASAGLGEELGNLGRRQNEAKDVIEGLSTAADGNASALFGVAKAAKNFWEILSGATPLGRVVQLAALAGAAFLALKDRLLGTAEAEKQIAAESARAQQKLEEFKAVAAKLSEERFENFKSNLAGITQKFADMRSEIDLVQAAADKLDNAEMAAQLAENKVMPGFSPDERDANERAIRGRFAEKKRERDEGVRQSKENLAVDELAAKERKEAEAAAAYRQMRAAVDANQRRPEDYERVQQELRRQLKSTPETFTRLDPTDISKDLITEENPVYKQLQEKLDDVTARLAQFTSENARARAGVAEKELDSRKSAFLTASDQANDAFGSLRAIRRSNTIDRQTEEALRNPEFRSRYAERFGAVADLRGAPDPVYKPENRVIDAASIRAAGSEEGRKTGAEIARAMQEWVRAHDEEVINKIKAARR